MVFFLRKKVLVTLDQMEEEESSDAIHQPQFFCSESEAWKAKRFIFDTLYFFLLMLILKIEYEYVISDFRHSNTDEGNTTQIMVEILKYQST
jgi:hypothetical protein